MSLYTKYRPKDWDSVIGQDLISSILRNSLRQDRVGHAYILTGSRWTGKTTTARILAKWVNCTDLQDGNPCHACANCIAFDNGSMLDIIEIDGASNNWVENVRDLIEKARFEPNQGKYKVYIIDEVHMLSTGAFNALLKTLEEPPTHVKFILATTEIEKVPETIRSRSLRFDFRKITEADIITRLQFVTKEEWVKVEDGSLEIIAKAARGGLRDALTLLEQNIIDGRLMTEYVRSGLSLIEESLITSLISAMYASDTDETLRILDSIRSRHIQVRGFFDQMMYTLRDHLVANIRNNEAFYRYDGILGCFEDAYTRIKALPDGMLLIELTLLRATKGLNPNTPTTPQIQESPKKGTPTKAPITPQKETPIEPITPPIVEEIPPPKTVQKIEKDTEIKEIKTEAVQEEKFSFLTLLHHIKAIRPAIIMDLKTARYELIWTHGLKLIFSKNWNYGRVNTHEVKNLVSESLTKCFWGEWAVECILQEAWNPTTQADDVF